MRAHSCLTSGLQPGPEAGLSSGASSALRDCPTRCSPGVHGFVCAPRAAGNDLTCCQHGLGRALVEELAQDVKLVACDIVERGAAFDHASVASNGADGLWLIATTVRLVPPSVGV